MSSSALALLKGTKTAITAFRHLLDARAERRTVKLLARLREHFPEDDALLQAAQNLDEADVERVIKALLDDDEDDKVWAYAAYIAACAMGQVPSDVRLRAIRCIRSLLAEEVLVVANARQHLDREGVFVDLPRTTREGLARWGFVRQRGDILRTLADRKLSAEEKARFVPTDSFSTLHRILSGHQL